MTITFTLQALKAGSIICLWMLTSYCRAGIAVIIHPDNPLNALSAAEIRDIYLGISKRFPSGDIAVPVDQPADNELYQQFSLHLLGYPVAQLKAYWAAKIFTGKGTPPRRLDNDEQVKAFVSSTPDSIGYIDSEQLDQSVKVIMKFNPQPLTLR